MYNLFTSLYTPETNKICKKSAAGAATITTKILWTLTQAHRNNKSCAWLAVPLCPGLSPEAQPGVGLAPVCLSFYCSNLSMCPLSSILSRISLPLQHHFLCTSLQWLFFSGPPKPSTRTLQRELKTWLRTTGEKEERTQNEPLPVSEKEQIEGY